MPQINKIALILPRGNLYRYKSGAFGVFIRYAPITLPFLASLIPAELNISVEIYDEGVEVIDKTKIKADLIGISAITGTFKRACAYAQYFKAQGIPVVIGGVHATMMPEEAANYADAIVCGNAVKSWPQLIKDYIDGNMKKIYNEPEFIDYSNWPAPDRTLYLDKKLRFISINSVQATYGCPNDCEFCTTPYSCKGYHHRPIEDVVREIADIKDKHIIFVDPSPIEDRNYAINLYKAMIPLGKKWVSPATIKIAYDAELLDIAVKSGCKGLLIGFESLSEKSLASINKNFNSSDNYYTAVKTLHGKGIAIMGCFVFGLDSDDKDIFKKTVDFINKANIDLPRFTVNTPYPGTPYYKKMMEQGRIIENSWSMYDCQHVVIKPKKMTARELQEGLYWAWKESYKFSSIVKRLALSGCFIEVMLLTNLAYRLYGYNLQKFSRDKMIDHSDILEDLEIDYEYCINIACNG